MADSLAPAKDDAKEQTDSQHEHKEPSEGSTSDAEKHAGRDIYPTRTEDEEYVVTKKTWLVVMTLAFSYGVSFWPVPFFSTIQTQIVTEFGTSPLYGTWFTSVYIIPVAIVFMVCGANSDLFGRRWFIIGGNIFVFVGSIVGATSHHLGQSIAAHVLLGIGAGNCQMAAFALPELLPNRWRHIGVVLADGAAFFCVIAGPVTARVAIRHGESWRWGYWSMAISIAFSFVILVLYYYPPQHPRGIPWDQALRTLDWVGILTFTAATTMILTGIVYVQLVPANDPIVIGLLVAGFACLIIFALWETFAPLKAPLTPTRLFINNKGRTLSAPFIVGLVVTMYYFGLNLLWGEMITYLFTTPTTPVTHIYWLATVQGFGTLLGGLLLSFLGNRLQHWRWQMGLSVTWMTFWGGLLAYVTPARQGVAIACAFLSATGFGWAQYLSITYIQFGADQTELGIAGGLAGVAREGGGAIAVTVFQTILVSVQKNYAASHVVKAAESAGASPKVAEAVAAALPLGTVSSVKGATTAIATAAGAAFTESYVHGLMTVALTLCGFGGLAMIACLFLEDIGPKMTRKIEIFLENTSEAHKNKYH